MKLLLNNCSIIKDPGKISSINILIEHNKITYIGKDIPEYNQKEELNGKLVLPGMIDPHTHIRDLALSYKEDWRTGSRASARGGVTTIFDMPNTDPPTNNINNLEKKIEFAKKLSIVNYSFHIGATENNLKQLEKMLSAYNNNIAGIKVFLAASSSNEVIKSEKTLSEIFTLSKKWDKPTLVHTELQECINKYKKKYSDNDYNNVRYHNQIRHRECSIKGTELVLGLCRKVGNKLYIAHTSTAEEIALIREYKKNYNLPLICEITPHHLLLNENILEIAGNFGKVNPPLREKKDNEALWEGIYDGTVDVIGSDHAPHRREEKTKPYFESPSGFPGLETTIPLLLNEVNKNRLSYDKLTSLISSNTAGIFNLKHRGKVKEGYYADLVVVDTETPYKIDPKSFESKAHYSPYDGIELKGKVIMTLINGNIVYKEGYINEDYKGSGDLFTYHKNSR
jgi:dihydroorotase